MPEQEGATKKATMLTAKYDMKMLKQIVEIDDQMKTQLCRLVGVSDEDELPDAVQNLDLQDYLGHDRADAKAALLEIFNMLSADKAELDALADDVSQRIQGLTMPDVVKET